MDCSSPCVIPSPLEKVSKYSIRHLCNIVSLPVQSPITNIVSSSSDTGSISSHQTLSFPLQADMNSPDSTGTGSPPLSDSQQTRQDKQERTEHFIQITSQTLDAWDDTAVGRHFEKIVLVKHPHLDRSYLGVLGLLVLLEAVICRGLGLAFC